MLKNYLYFDRKKIERYLSSLQDGFIKERRVTKEAQEGSKSGSINLGVATLGRETGSQRTTINEITSLSDTALFDEFEKLLKKTNEYVHRPTKELGTIKSYLKQAKRGMLIEVKGKFRVSIFDQVLNKFNSLLPAIEKKTPNYATMKQQMDVFRSNFVSVTITGKKYSNLTFLSRLNKKMLESEMEELNEELIIFGRIKRALIRKMDPSLKLYNITGDLNLPESILTTMFGNLDKNPAYTKMFNLETPYSIKNFEISAPAIEIDPVVIYW